MQCLTNTIGIDEVGRGPLAGPLCVAAVFCMPLFDSDLPERYDQVQDSKKLTASKREYLSQQLLTHPAIVSSISSSPPSSIDKYGIVASLRHASKRVLKNILLQLQALGYDKVPLLIIDGNHDFGLSKELLCRNGSLRRSFLSMFLSQESSFLKTDAFAIATKTHGDASVRQIAAASIIAKVWRDRYMIELSHKKKYRHYGFERHKGYGTAFHRSMIERYGLSDNHRTSFCSSFSSGEH